MARNLGTGRNQGTWSSLLTATGVHQVALRTEIQLNKMNGWMERPGTESVNINHIFHQDIKAQDIKALNRDSSPTETAFDDSELICTGSANAALSNTEYSCGCNSKS